MYKFDVDVPEAVRDLATKTMIGFKLIRDEYAFAECPYCHKKASYNQKKFSINAKTGQFQCFRAGCEAHGNILTLAKDFDLDIGVAASEYYGVGNIRHYEYTVLKEPIESKGIAIDYMKSRGISEEVVRKYQITTNSDNNIVFPFIDENNRLQFTKFRNPNPGEGQSKEWSAKDRKPILFGMYQCNPENKTLIITEGQIDSLSVAEAGIENAVSVPTGARGFTWVPYCWDFMRNFEKIIVFGDHENGQITLFKELAARLENKTWHVREEDYKDCKDANDILRKYGAEQIRRCIDNAVRLPISDVIDLADVEDVNPYELPKAATGINAIDKLLFGGLPFGQVVLLTGKAGDGKSTFASQIMVNALDQGFKCFAYSGELPNYIFRNWINFQAAGLKNLTSNKGKWEIYYTLDNETREQIKTWYKGRFYLYDNSDKEFSEEQQKGLIELLESVIAQYNVNVILLDNLMTGLDLESNLGTDKYEKQSLFMKRLARVARNNKVLILLVAHKRKPTGNDYVNDSVSGSLDIVNLASIVISYERPSKKRLENDELVTAQDRICKVTKNRLFGRIDEWGIALHYEDGSKRIYSNENEKTKQYGWKSFEPVEKETAEFPW